MTLRSFLLNAFFYCKKNFLCCFLIFISFHSFSQGTWVSKATFSVGRMGGAGFSIGTKGYIGFGAGTNYSGPYYNDLWEYDQASNSWTQKSTCPGAARMTPIGFSIGTKGYFSIGSLGQGNGYNDLWEWDQATNTWTSKAVFPGGTRGFAAGFSIGTSGYIATGVNYPAGTNTNDLWEYNQTTDTWTQKANLPGVARRFAGGFTIGTKGYVGGGYDGGSYLSDFWEYDPSVNVWVQKANIPAPRFEFIAFSICKLGYWGTGSPSASTSSNDFWQYDPTINVWTQMANYLGGNKERAVGFVIGTKGYVGTGYCGDTQCGSTTNDFYEFSPPVPCCVKDSLVASSVNLCTGQNVTLTVIGGATSYHWNTGATTSSIIVAPSVTTTYSIIGTGTCGADTNKVTVNVGPAVTPSISANTSICSGAFTTLNASGGASFSWSSGQTTSSIVVSPPNTTTYSVIIANGACASTQTVTVNVTPTPIITSSNSAICTGGSVQLNTIYQLGCGIHGTTCSGPTTASQIGTATTYTSTTGATPFAAQTNSAKFQYLYKASELFAAGMNQPMTIKEIGFNIQQLLGLNPYQNFTIKMSCTSADSLTAYQSGLPTVFNPKNVALSSGVNYLVLDNAYDWDGTSNIVVEICFSNTTASQNSFTYYSTTAFNSVIYASGLSVCNNLTGTKSKDRPNTYFRHCTSNAGGGFTYSWAPAIFLNNTTIANPVATPTSSTTYTETVTNPSVGCVSPATVTVAVGTPFTLISSHDTTICQSSGIQIFTSPNGGNGAYTYSWTPTTSLSNPNISNPVATPIATTSYIVTAQSNGCTAHDTVKIKVPYLYNFFVTPSADSICIGQSVPLTSMLQNVCGVHSSTCTSTSTAQVGTAATTSASNNITTFAGVFNSSRFQYLYLANELNAAGITGASTITQLGLNVSAVTGSNVYQNFTVKMGCTGQNALTTNYINGLQTVFNAKPFVISNGIDYLAFDNTYDWDGVSNIVVEICFNNAVTSPNSSIYYSTTAFQSGLYYSANTSACSNSTGTTVSTRPNTYFKSCSGQGLGTLVYSWTPSSTLSISSISNPIATPTASTSYVLVAVDTASGCIFSDSTAITASPIFSLSSTNGIINCSTSGVQIHVTTSPSGNYSYSWSPAVALSSTTVANPVAAPSVTTIYTVTVTSPMGCSISDTVKVTVTVPNLYSFGVIPGKDTICSGSSIQFSALVQKGCGANGSICGGPVTSSQIGTSLLFSNATGITPFAGSVNSSKCQFLYKASELIAGGMTQPTTISQIGINIQSIVGSNSYQNFTIKMGCTSTNTLTTTYIGSLPIVYIAKPTAIFNGLNYFTLDNFYDWDGVSNIVVEICFSNSVVSQNSYVYYSTTAFASAIYSSGVSACANVTGVTGTGRPNIYFKHCGATGGSNFDYLWTPALTLNLDTIPNPVASPTTLTTYTLTVTDPSSGCVMRDTSTIVVFGTASAVINLGHDSVLCTGNNVTLNAGAGFTSYQWSTGASTSSILVSTPGAYWVVGTNVCGTDRDTVNINYYPANSLSLGPDVNICTGSTITLTTNATGFTNYLWNAGQTTSSIVVNAPGTYWVSSSNTCGSAADTIKVLPLIFPVVNLGNDTILCVGNTKTLNAGGGAISYQWSTGASSSSILVSAPGSYWVVGTNLCGTDRDTVNISYYPANSLSLGPDINICSGNSATLTAAVTGFTNYLWSTGQTTSSIVVNATGTYWISSSNTCGSAADTIKVLPLNFPVVSLGNDTVICTQTTLTPSATSASGYVWSTGATTSSIVITQPGTYWITCTNQCGTANDTIVIGQGIKPVFTLGPDTILCVTTPLNINLTGIGTGFLWQDNSTLPTYTISTSGNYWVVVTNAAGCKNSDSISVSFDSPPHVFAGKDTVICNGQEITLIPVSSGSYFWNNGTSNVPLVVNAEGIYIVYTSNKCGTARDSVKVNTEQCTCLLDVPNAFSPNDDGKNDIFYVRGDCDLFILRIYDRWGEKVFESTHLADGWDGTFKGKKMNSGIFDYYLIIRPESSDQKIKKGNISLIR